MAFNVSSKESKAFQDFFLILKDGLQSGLGDIADQAFTKRLIPGDVHTQVTSRQVSSCLM